MLIRKVARRRIVSAMLFGVCCSCGVFAAFAQDVPQHVTVSDVQAAIAANHLSEAEAICRQLLRKDPKDAAVSEALALTLHLQGRYSEALATLRPVIKLTPSAKAWALMASSYCRLGNFASAASTLQKLKPWPQDDALLSQIAPCVLIAGDPFDGPEVYGLLVEHKAEPQDEYQVGLARAYIQASRTVLTRLRSLPDQLYVDAAKAAQQSSAESSYAFASAMQAVPSLSPQMSLPAMASTLAEHPESPAALFGLGAIAGDRGVEIYEQALQRYPNALPLFLFQAEMLGSTGRIDDAASAYRDILKSFPDTPGVHFLIGTLYRSAHRWEEALLEFRAQAELTPNDDRVVEAVEGCLQGAGRYGESYAYLKAILARPNTPLWALQDFAKAAKEIGKPRESITALVRAEAINPSDSTNHYKLFVLYKEMNESSKAAIELAAFKRLKIAEEAKSTSK